MLVRPGIRLEQFNALSKDSTIAAAYAVLPEIKELISSLDENDQESYDKLYTLSRDSLLQKLDTYIGDATPFYHGDQNCFHVEIGNTVAKIINILNDDDGDWSYFYHEFFKDLIDYFYAVNVGAFAPYLWPEYKNDDGFDAIRMQASWDAMNARGENGNQHAAAYFLKRWDIDWDEFMEAMLYDKKKRKTFFKDFSKTIAMPDSYASRRNLKFENSQFVINDKTYLIFILRRDKTPRKD